MAVRFVGEAKIVVVYLGQSLDGYDRAEYRVRVTDVRPLVGCRSWKGKVSSAVGGPEIVCTDGKRRKVAVDSSEAYDEIARSAVLFAMSADRSDPETERETSEAIQDAVCSAWHGFDLQVRRSR